MTTCFRSIRGVLGTAVLALLAVAPTAGSSAANEVRGTVTDPQRKALPGIEVRLYGAPGAAGQERPLVGQGVTGAGGRFAIDASRANPELLELRGPQGTGRVRLKARARALRVVYPVRTTIVLLHDNDVHFEFRHGEPLHAAVEQMRSRYENVFLLSAGDIFVRRPDRWSEPTPAYYARRCGAMIDLMNRVGYDVMTAGNHELYYINGLTRSALETARFPILAANAVVTTDLLPPFKPYTTLVTGNDLSVAVLGLTIVNFQKDGVAGRDPIEVAREHLHLADEHTVFVGLTHIGHRTDRRLAEAVGAFDVIIGGHSHTLLEEAVLVNDVLVAQAGGGGTHLGVVKLVLQNDDIVEKRGKVFPLSRAAPARAGAPATR